MKWNIIDTGEATAEKNMAIDYALLRDLKSTPQPILHFYEWEGDCATYGHFLDPYKFLNRNAVEKHGLQLARRPTGGGIVFHLTDFAYSILVPSSHPEYSVNTLENYAFINNMIAKAIQKFMGTKETPGLLQSEPQASHPHAEHFCMAKPTQLDVMWQGKKVGGGAQRRTKHGFLHQGTISLGKPDENYLKDILVEENLIESFIQNGFYQDLSRSCTLELKKEIVLTFEKIS